MYKFKKVEWRNALRKTSRATDAFLHGRFRYYGLDVIRYYSLSKADRKGSVDPMCAAFPTEVVLSLRGFYYL